jgi:outer membrane protein assembly factor BamB
MSRLPKYTAGSLLVALIAAIGALAGTGPLQATATISDPGWASFQHDGQISGADPSQAQVTAVAPGWTSANLDGLLVAQPLEVGGHVLVATENNTVYALNAADGSVAWHTNLGTAVMASTLPCGRLKGTVGISGTPVIDTVSGVLYAVAFLASPVHHELYALNLSDGSIAWHRAIDAPGADPSVHDQGGALALSAGNVYVPFGGLYGGCGNFTGRVVASPKDGSGSVTSYTVLVNPSGGGIGGNNGPWAAGPTVDPSTGDLLVATGPNFAPVAQDGSQSVLRLSSALAGLDSFTQSNWLGLNNSDVELTSGPALIGGNRLLELSQSGYGYLLNAAALGGVGGQLFSANACSTSGGVATGSVAVHGLVAFIPCSGGVVAITVAADGMSFSSTWAGPAGQAGTPIYTGGQVWSLYADGNLYALDAATGAVDFHTTVASTIPNGGLASGGGHVFVPAGSTMAAFTLNPPTVSGITPNAVGQGARNLSVSIAGSGFGAGDTVSASGSGVTLGTVTVVNATTITAKLTATSSAAIGTRDLVIATPSSGTITCSACLTVTAHPAPASLTPGSLQTGASGVSISVNGTGFEVGSTKLTITGPSTGVKAKSVAFVSPTQLTAKLSVAATATLGAYTVKITNPDGGTGSCVGCLTITQGPTLAGITPNTAARGQKVTVTLSGQFFSSGATVKGPSGVKFTLVTVVDSSTITALMTVSTTAATGSNLTVTVVDPPGVGSGSGACACLTIT